jgi:phosphate transport system substrate-binding protein
MPKKLVLLLLSALALAAMPVSSCESPQPETGSGLTAYFSVKDIRQTNLKLRDIGLTPENFPPIDGATATQPIRGLIAGTAFGAECRWFETLDREMFLFPDMRTSNLTAADAEKVLTRINTNSKTHEAYLRLIGGQIDLILVATRPSDEELEEARRNGVKLELFPIGLDGLVFLVNDKNPVTDLSTKSIIDIYTAKATNWARLGGEDLPITPYTRQTNSGSQELMNKLVMKGVPMDPSVKTERSMILSMAPLIEGVEDDPKSIGYSLYYYKNSMIDRRPEPPGIKLIAVDGVEPNPETIALGRYPYVFNVYAVTRADEPKDSRAYQVKQWLTSEEGQQLIEQAGYVRMANR